MRHRVRILNVEFDNLSRAELFEDLAHGFVAGANVDVVMQQQHNRKLWNVYRHAEYVIEDGQILMWAARFLGTPFADRLSGSDIFPAFCEYHRHDPSIKVFLLGGEPGVAARARDLLNHRLGRQIIVGSYSPPLNLEPPEIETNTIVERITASGANVLGVGLGTPKQEIWIHENRARLPGIDVFFSLGATIDFIAGQKRRAPPLVRDLGLEWLFRLCCEPRRLWRRYLIRGLPFPWLIFKQRLGAYKSERGIL